MTIKKRVGHYKECENEFVFIKMDTLIERLRRMRALNSTPANVGITQYTLKNCGMQKRNIFK